MNLRPQELAKEWAAGRFRAVYYLVGAVDDVKDAIAEIKKRFQADSFNFSEFLRDDEPPSAALSDAQTAPVFADRRLVVVANPRIVAKDADAFLEYVKDPLSSTTLVLVSHERKANPKDRLFAAASAAGAATVFQPLREDDARTRLLQQARARGKSIAPEAVKVLITEAGTDWHILRQELEKAALYVGEEKTITREAVLECLGFQKGADPFALPRLVQRRDLGPCLEHMHRLFSSGNPDDHAYRCLAQVRNAVSKQLRAKRMLRRGASPQAVFDSLRLNRYYDQRYLDWLKPLSELRLAGDLRACVATEADMKSKAWLDPRQEVERLVARLCRKARLET